MRLAIGSIMHEANTFSPLPTRLSDFERSGIHTGEEIVASLADVNCEMAGFMDVLREEGVQFVPTISAKAMPGGRVTRDAFQPLRDLLLERLREAGPLDGVLLAPHGAMAVEGIDDGDGEWLEAVRSEVGADIPIVISLDMHANITQRKISLVNAIAGYHTEPHVDMREVGRKAARMMLGILRRQTRPVIAWRKLPMITSPEHHDTTEGPMAELFERVARSERKPGILFANLFAVQPFMDLEDLGWATVVVADGDQELARSEATDIGDLAWQMRRRFLFQPTPLSEALERAKEIDGGPVILVDCADSPNAGATGDSTAVLRALLESGSQETVLLTLADADVVDRAFVAGVGGEISTRIGGKRGRYPSLAITARVKSLGDGEFIQEGPVGKGMRVDMQGVAVLQLGNIHIVVGRAPDGGHDPQVYRSVGLEPKDAKLVVVKSPADFRASYGPFAREIIFPDTPGPASSNLKRLDFTRVPRPLFPLDDI